MPLILGEAAVDGGGAEVDGSGEAAVSGLAQRAADWLRLRLEIRKPGVAAVGTLKQGQRRATRDILCGGLRTGPEEIWRAPY